MGVSSGKDIEVTNQGTYQASRKQEDDKSLFDALAGLLKINPSNQMMKEGICAMRKKYLELRVKFFQVSIEDLAIPIPFMRLTSNILHQHITFSSGAVEVN
jgi:hypothetical protein